MPEIIRPNPADSEVVPNKEECLSGGKNNYRVRAISVIVGVDSLAQQLHRLLV